MSGTSVGSTAEYSCSVGFLLLGAQTRYCQPNGEWSGNPPICEGKEVYNHIYKMREEDAHSLL